jgi:hypothetical protein
MEHKVEMELKDHQMELKDLMVIMKTNWDQPVKKDTLKWSSKKCKPNSVQTGQQMKTKVSISS